MRRADRQVTDLQEISAMLDRCDTIRLGLQGVEYPYVVPLSFGWELTDDAIRIYFHGAKEGLKHDLIVQNNKVCVEADRFVRYTGNSHSATTEYESVIGFGIITECDHAASVRGLELLMTHCGFDGSSAEDCVKLGVTKVYQVTLTAVTGKKNI